MEIPDIKSNSLKARNERREQAYERKEGNYEKRERATKVVQSSVKTQKQGGFSKLAGKIIADDASNVKSYIRDDVIIPAVKDTILDIIIKGATMIFGGGRRADKNSPLSNISYYNYGSRFDNRYGSGRPQAEPARAHMGFNYDNLIFSSRADAEMVLDQMWGSIQRYGLVTVMDMYDMADMSAPYTSDKYGWTNINTATVERVYGGYIIKLPKAMPID